MSDIAEITEILDPISRITKDIRAAARLISSAEARFLVDAYYIMQKDRIRSSHQIRTLEAGGEPNLVMEWLEAQTTALEASMQRALDAYSTSRPDGVWLRSITGIGPVIAAGLMAHIDIRQAPTVGHIWRFAGLDPTTKWDKETRRPWNGALKRLCWILGESFVKVAYLEKDVYGKVYVARKRLEVERNDAGTFADQAAAALKAKRYDRESEARRWYQGEYPGGTTAALLGMDTAKREAHLKVVRVAPGEGTPMLPPAHIHARSKRYAAKLLLAHYHHVAHCVEYGTEPPLPYIIAKEPLLHTTFLGPPNWPMQ